MNQAVLMSNQAESSKQPNLNAEDAQQQSSGTCDVPEGQTRKAIHVNENPDVVEDLCNDIGDTNTITTKQQSLETKEATPDQGARVASGVVTPLPASEMSHLSQDHYLKCIRTPDDHFMDSSFAQNAIELFDWKINAERDHPGVYFLAELVADLKQLHTSEDNLSLGANPPMRTNEHENTLGKCIEELNEVDEKILEYEKVLGDLKKQRQKLLQRRTSLFEQKKKRKKLFEAVKIDLCEARSYSI